MKQLAPRYKKLNDDLISLFATFDSWCDPRGDLEEETTHKAIVLEFLIASDHLVSMTRPDYTRQQEVAQYEQALSTLRAKWDDFKCIEELRPQLREVLFTLLCAVDEVQKGERDSNIVSGLERLINAGNSCVNVFFGHFERV